MKIFPVILSVISLIALAGCSDKGAESVESVSSLGIYPAALVISVGEETMLTVEAGDFGASIFGISMRIGYDSTIVSLEQAEGGSEGGFFPVEAIFFVHSDDNAIYLTVTLTQDQEAVSGSGRIAELTFTGLAVGSCELEILPEELHFYDAEGSEIEIAEVEITGAEITVAG